MKRGIAGSLFALLLALCEGSDTPAAAHAEFNAQAVELRHITGEIVMTAQANQELPYWVADDLPQLNTRVQNS